MQTYKVAPCASEVIILRVEPIIRNRELNNIAHRRPGGKVKKLRLCLTLIVIYDPNEKSLFIADLILHPHTPGKKRD